MELHSGSIRLRITEVEAYRWPEDSANHGCAGRTARNAAMWGPPGHAYVYLCYGIHNLLNVVTQTEGAPAAVLIRSAEPICGIAQIQARRKNISGPKLLNGPGKLGQALDVDRSWSNHAFYESGGLELHSGEHPERILLGPRVGIDFAKPQHRDAHWRFACANTPWISKKSSLQPE